MEKANETISFYENRQSEDKELFIHNLGWLLSQTRNQVRTCLYYELENGDEVATIVFTNGYTVNVNINMDSYLAIIKDVAKAVI